MAPILTPEDVVRRIAADCTFIDERGAVGIRLEPAAVIVRQKGELFRAGRRKQARRLPKPGHGRRQHRLQGDTRHLCRDTFAEQIPGRETELRQSGGRGFESWSLRHHK